jgi:hypothetical protein
MNRSKWTITTALLAWVVCAGQAGKPQTLTQAVQSIRAAAAPGGFLSTSLI